MFEELMEKARIEAENYYRNQIEQLSSKIDHLEDLLKQNNIQFD